MTEWSKEEALDSAREVVDWLKTMAKNPRKHSGHDLRCAFQAGYETIERLSEMLATDGAEGMTNTDNERPKITPTGSMG